MNKQLQYSFKVLNFVQHSKFIKDNKYSSPIAHCIDGKTYLFSNIEQLKQNITSKYINQSCVLYKFDNYKIKNLKFYDEKKIFVTDEIFYQNVIVEKKIFFDDNRINQYFNDLQNINKYLENN